MNNIKLIKYLPFIILISIYTLGSENAIASACEDLAWKRGRPFDYYAPETNVPNGTYARGLLNMVNHAHFTMEVQLLQKGKSARLPGDILFVLMSIPNHPGALDTYSRFVVKYRTSELFKNSNKTLKPAYDPDCFFQRATRIYPQHAETHKVWGIHLYREKRYSDALSAFLEAQSKGDTSAEIQYNLGLTYLALEDNENAVTYARKAYNAGYPLQGLRKKLGDKLD